MRTISVRKILSPKSDAYNWTEIQRDRRTARQIERQMRSAHAAAIFIEGGHLYIKKALQSYLSKIYWGYPANFSI